MVRDDDEEDGDDDDVEDDDEVKNGMVGLLEWIHDGRFWDVDGDESIVFGAGRGRSGATLSAQVSIVGQGCHTRTSV